ncbi:MAG: PDZ domain-containing protein [Halofilum sp. (in: g-proteobacteria)]|nr:PDZ domain-containing protein [Halofilum sp. (in: g-proteobacteria)]
MLASAAVAVEPGGETPAPVRSAAPGVVALTAGNGIAGSIGSGVVIGRDGLVLAADHVAAFGAAVEVRVDGRIIPTRTVARDPVADLHLLQAAGLDRPVVSIAEAGSLQAGDRVWAIGAGAIGMTARAGTVTASDQVIDELLPDVPLTLVETPLRRGDSGGALLGLDGRLVGLLTAVRDSPDSATAIAAAIPGSVIRRFLYRVQERRLPPRGWLGVELDTPLLSPSGLTISSIHTGSPAAAAGLRAGDRIIAIDDEPVRETTLFHARVAGRSPGERVSLRIGRSGTVVERSITVGHLPQPMMR